MIYFNYNGKLFKEGTPIIGADSRALRYGDGVFETMKYENGQLVFADEHFARLWKGMQLLQLEIPKHFSPELLEEEMRGLLQKNGYQNNARVRLTVIRGDGGLYDAINHQPNYIIQTWALQPHSNEWNINGLVLGIYTAVRKSCDRLSNVKHNNFMPYLMAALTAKNNQWNDAVVLNTAGRICDTSIANIFLIKNDTIYTPSLAEGCVAGIVRKHFVTNLPLHGFTLIEKEITEEELLQAEEVFLTNSIDNLRWVQRIGDKQYQNNITQKIYAALIPTMLKG